LSDEFIIDGSSGEGGGQILRTSLAMSAVTGKQVTIERIRANRPKPGLAAQHLAGMELLGEMCGAEIIGGRPGSTKVEFIPGKMSHGEYTKDVGTAGSVTLVLQTILPALASVNGMSRITLIGGTDVKWSPPLDYYTLVLFPLLRKFDLECSLTIESRGYYPRGGGKVVAEIASKGCLVPLTLNPLSEPSKINGIVNVTGLPEGIAERVKASAVASLPAGLRELADIRVDARESGPSQGVGIVLAATDGKTIMGASSLGEKGKPAEKVGQGAAEALVAELNGGAIDLHASDQMLPYLAMAGGSYTARKITEHARTNMATISHFLGDAIRVEEGRTVTFSK
jgi:RNA 3'-phosphate cyclase